MVLLTLVAIALLRGSIYGAAAGFFAGLIVDTANLGTLGVTSLLLTIAGYWIGRYGETTGRDRAHAPFVSVAVATVLVQFGALIMHYLLGDAGLRRRRAARGAAAEGGAEPAADAAGLRARRGGSSARPAGRARRRRSSSLASTGTRRRRSGSDRFLPPDPRVERPYRLTPQLALRIGILGAVALLAFGVLFFRLWALQVLSGPQYLRRRSEQPAARRSASRRRAGRSSTATAARSSINVPGTAVEV